GGRRVGVRPEASARRQRGWSRVRRLRRASLRGGFGDAVVEVVADLDQALCLSRVGSKQRTSDATVLMQARRSEVAGAGAQGDLAQLEVAEELVPFLRREVAVFLCRSQPASARDEGPMVGDDVLRVDRG